MSSISIKKYKEYIKESIVSIIEIEEYAKEESKKLIENLYEKMAKKFPIDSSKLTEEQELLKNKLIKELSDLISNITINNISFLNKDIDI